MINKQTVVFLSHSYQLKRNLSLFLIRDSSVAVNWCGRKKKKKKREKRKRNRKKGENRCSLNMLSDGKEKRKGNEYIWKW